MCKKPYRRFVDLLCGLSLICLNSSLTFAATTNATTNATSNPKPAYLQASAVSASDRLALLKLCQQFQQALRDKDTNLLRSLLLNERILFNSPASPERTRQIRAQKNPQFDGVMANGAQAFIAFVGQSQQPVEERFYDIQIQQDQHLAWLHFDFEFLENGEVTNYGQEHWQVLKVSESEWKILSVVWSSHGKPQQATQ